MNRWRIWVAGALRFCLASQATQGAFLPGDQFYVASDKVYRTSDGGSYAAAAPFVTLPSLSIGQIAFDADRSAMYVSQFNTHTILKITPDGTTSTFATGVGATGMLRLNDGRLLAVGGGTIFDITGGGTITIANVFATGLNFARNLLETSDGRILVAAQNLNNVYDISAGGDFSKAIPFAKVSGVADLVQDSTGRIFGSQVGGKVFDITGGGDFTSAPAFASGRSFMGLAITGDGRLLASVLTGVPTPGAVYDITAGGDFSRAPAFATGLTGGESNIDTVPLPEPAAIGALGLTLLLISGRRSRRTI